jgi:hypothetical protein
MKRKRQTRLSPEERQKQLELSQTQHIKALTGLVSLTLYAISSLQRRQDGPLKPEQTAEPAI